MPPQRARMGSRAHPLVLLLLSLASVTIRAANWAQCTGQPAQNNVIPRIPNPDIVSAKSGSFYGKNDHWSSRQGMGYVRVPKNDTTGQPESIFVIGGDSYVRSGQYWQHGGRYMNDVWYTAGIQWHTVWDFEVKVSGEKRMPLRKEGVYGTD